MRHRCVWKMGGSGLERVRRVSLRRLKRGLCALAANDGPDRREMVQEIRAGDCCPGMISPRQACAARKDRTSRCSNGQAGSLSGIR